MICRGIPISLLVLENNQFFGAKTGFNVIIKVKKKIYVKVF